MVVFSQTVFWQDFLNYVICSIFELSVGHPDILLRMQKTFCVAFHCFECESAEHLLFCVYFSTSFIHDVS